MVSSQDLARWAEQAGLRQAIVLLEHLDDDAGGPAVAGDPDRYLYPASMLKTPLALAALSLVADGELTLDQSFAVTGANMTVNDKPSPLVPGYSSALRELLELAITRSDNVGTNMLYDIVGRERAGAILAQRYGLRDTAFHRKLSGDYPLIDDPQWDGKHRNRHSARDAFALFTAIARTRVPFASLLRGMLSRQEWNNKLSTGLLDGDRFDHKTGDTDEVTHDGGILELADGRSFAIVVYTGMPSSDENNATFGEFMRRLREVI